MSSHSTHPTTLPLLIAYSKALLPSLLADTQKQNTDTVSGTETSDNIALPILWVVADNNEVKKLNQQLINKQAIQADDQNISESKIKNVIEKEAKKHTEITTLAQLNKQNVRQRYELGCFWLPTSQRSSYSHLLLLLCAIEIYMPLICSFAHCY